MSSAESLLIGGEEPLYRQIYERFRRAIANGTYGPGMRVPSVRNLASELQISRGTVEMAYDLLIGDGYLVARGQAGTIVSPSLAAQQVHNSLQRANPVTSAGRSPHIVQEAYPQPFQVGLPALDQFPHKLWATLVTKQARVQTRHFTYPNPAGYQPLREAIASHLQISRGLDCQPEQVFVMSGYRGAMSLLARTLLRPLDEFWLEDPCLRLSRRHLFAEMGARLVSVPVDKDGICVAKGKELAPHARFALVSRTYASPGGVTLSLERRLELIAWAQQNNAFIIEDDYDSEFRYDGRLPALASFVATDNVLFVGTFSKALSPALCLTYLVVPKTLVARFDESCARLHDGSPVLIQGVTADFINQGYFARHLKKMRHVYSQRREMVVQSLRATFGERMQFDDMPCGLTLLAGLDDAEDDLLLAQKAKKSHLAVEPLSVRYIDAPPKKGLLLGFANVKSESGALALARDLKQALDASD